MFNENDSADLLLDAIDDDDESGLDDAEDADEDEDEKDSLNPKTAGWGEEEKE